MNPLLFLHFDVRGDLLDAALDCEEDVFLQAFGNTREQLNDEYGPYNEQSVFMAVADEGGEVVGVARLITPGPAGLKTLNDVKRDPWNIDGDRSARAAGIDTSRTWDIATLGVRESFRGKRLMVAMSLYHGIMASTRLNEVLTATAIMDDQVRRLLTASGYYFPILPGAATRPYLGSVASTPCYGHYAGIIDAQRRTNPEAYRLMTLGIGLDGIVVPDQSEFMLKPRPALVGAQASASLSERMSSVA